MCKLHQSKTKELSKDQRCEELMKTPTWIATFFNCWLSLSFQKLSTTRHLCFHMDWLDISSILAWSLVLAAWESTILYRFVILYDFFLDKPLVVMIFNIDSITLPVSYYTRQETRCGLCFPLNQPTTTGFVPCFLRMFEWLLHNWMSTFVTLHNCEHKKSSRVQCWAGYTY